MSYPSYDGYPEPVYSAPAATRMNGPLHSAYEASGPSRSLAYDRYVPSQDDTRYRASYGDSYRPEGDSYRPGGGDSYRSNSWSYHQGGHSGDHYEPAVESDDWRGQDSWASGYPQQYHERERRSESEHWEPEHRDTMAERMFEPSEAWMSSHPSRSSLRSNHIDQCPDPRTRDYRSTSPGRRSRDGHGSLYSSPALGDFYRPESVQPPPAETRYARAADCYRPGEEAHTGSYVPDAHPGPHWRRGRSPSPRARAVFEGSHWDPEHDRSYSGSASRSRSRSSRSRDRREGVLNLPARSRSSSVSSAPRPHILPSRPIHMESLSHRSSSSRPVLAIATDGPRAYSSDQMSPASAKFKQAPHPSLPPRPVPVARDRAHYTGEESSSAVYFGQRLRGTSPNDQRKRKTRRGGQGRRRHANLQNGQASNHSGVNPPARWPMFQQNSHSHSSSPLESAAKPQVQGVSLPNSHPTEPISERLVSDSVLAVKTELLPHSLSSTIPPVPPAHSPPPLVAGGSEVLPSSSSPTELHSPRGVQQDAQLSKESRPVFVLPSSDTSLDATLSDIPPPISQPSIALSPPSLSLAGDAFMRLSSESPSAAAMLFSTETAPAVAIADKTATDALAAGTLAADVLPSNINSEKGTNYGYMSGHSRPAESLQDALQMAISARKIFDQQSRQERVAPVLLANSELLTMHHTAILASVCPHGVQDPTLEERERARVELFNEKMGARLKKFVDEHRHMIKQKQHALRAEYLRLHNAWLKRCEELDHATQIVSASTSVEDATAASSGRTTRRSAAVVGDTVRSDLEMEQIIASLGNEDLFDPAILATKNVAKIPDMISVTFGRVETLFDNTNCAVNDPASFYDPGLSMASWTDDEERVFVEQYAAHPKQFGKIAEALPQKTASECVLFYYLHKKKLLDFRRAVAAFGRSRGRGRGRGTKKRGNALLADIRAHDAEMRDGSAEDDGASKARKRRAAAVAAASITTGANAGRRGPRRTTIQVEAVATPGTATPTPEPEARPKRRRAVKAALDSIDHGEGSESERPAKKAKRSRKHKTASFVQEEDGFDNTIVEKASDAGKGEARRKAAGWTDADKMQFIELLSRHGDNWDAIAVGLGNKTPIQAMAFYKANVVELQLDGILETHKRKKSALSAASAIATPIEAGTPITEPPTTAAPSIHGSPAPPSINMSNSVPMLIGPKVYPYGFPPQPPAGGWPMAPLSSNPVDFLVSGVYQVPHGYPSTSSAAPYQYSNHNLRMS